MSHFRVVHSLLFVPLLLLGIFLGESQQEKHLSCFHAQRYGTDEGMEGLKELMTNVWIVPAVGQESLECLKKVNCMTFRCQDNLGADLFVINACGNEKDKGEKCSNDELDAFCSKQFGNAMKANCTQCFKDECNGANIELAKPKPTTTTTTEASPPIKGKCLLSFWHSDLFKPSGKLEEFVREIGNSTDKNDCDGKKCQTLRCKNENGDDLFEYKDCATTKGKCSNAIKKFCVKPANYTCGICEGNGCNSENQTHNTDPLPTVPASPISSSTRSSPAIAPSASPPVLPPAIVDNFKPINTLHCVVGMSCEAHKYLKNNNALATAKLSRRFMIRQKNVAAKCEDLIKKLEKEKENKKEKAKLNKMDIEYSKNSEKNGFVFVEEFIMALV